MFCYLCRNFRLLFAAFKFCLKYNRKTEFRKLCDNVSVGLMGLSLVTNQQLTICTCSVISAHVQIVSCC